MNAKFYEKEVTAIDNNASLNIFLMIFPSVWVIPLKGRKDYSSEAQRLGIDANSWKIRWSTKPRS